MSIPSRLSSYLSQRGASYEIRAHAHSRSSAETARSAHIEPRLLAKSVLLEDGEGCVLAVVPGDRDVEVDEVCELLGRRALRLADEDRIAELLADCDRGAIPPLGMAWGIETIIDDGFAASDVVCFEGGDHERLLCMSGSQFQDLMSEARRGSFSRSMFH